MTLENLDATQWRYLRKAAADPHHPFRNVTLATTGADGTPQARYLILRRADEGTRTLELHTDIRSAKWAEVAGQPKVSILAYDTQARIQLRLTGTAHRHPPGDPVNEAAWGALSTWARKTYCGGPPGIITDWVEVDPISDLPPPASEVEAGRSCFGVLTLKITAMDWFKHPRGDIRRAQISYAPDGTIAYANWVEP